jgi:hypothetical protein
MNNAPILAPEDRVIQTGEHIIGQPIDTSAGYPTVYKSPIDTGIGDTNPKYWIECIQDNKCGEKSLYDIHKDLFPTQSEKIMSCSETAINLCNPGNELVFRHKGMVQAKLCYKRGNELTGRYSYSLMNQQEELGLVYVYNNSEDKIDFYPFFELTRINSRCSSIIGLLIIVIILAGTLLVGTKVEGAVPMVIGIILAVLVLIAFCYNCLSPSCEKDGVNRLHTSNVKDMRSGGLVAKVYSLRGSCGSHSNDIEIICYRSLNTAQLLGLFCLTILSSSKKKREERRRRNNAHFT